MYLHMSTHMNGGTQRDLKKVPDPLKLELQVVEQFHMGAGNLTQYKSRSSLNLSHLSSL